jgi:putative ABC transport system permease protein
MFFTYLWNELRRRRKQTVVVALGLALGIALVVTVSSMAAGVKDAQGTVLSSLYGVGTDMTVTQTSQPDDQGAGGPGFQISQGGSQGFSRDRIFADPGTATFSEGRVAAIAGMNDVSAASGGLSLTATHLKGKLPEFASDPGSAPVVGSGSGAGQTQGPTQANINVSTFSLMGVDVRGRVGPLSASQVERGRAFDASDDDARVAIVDEANAADQDLQVGDELTIGGTRFEVIGIATGPTGGGGSDVYVPLAQAQKLADEQDAVNLVYVQASSSTDIDRVQSQIEAAYPKATVTTANELASQVSGSLSSASDLLHTLGTWLSIAVVAAAVVLASLLTLSSVGRRTRELGTLKALGWRTRRVVGQVMGESLVQGLLGGVVGIALGLLGAAAVTRFAPSLAATVSPLPTSGGVTVAGPPGAAAGGPGADPFSTTVQVALHAPVSVTLAVLAIGLALVGGVIAGSLGGWRAARLRPADAMRQVV